MFRDLKRIFQSLVFSLLIAVITGAVARFALGALIFGWRLAGGDLWR